MYTYAELLSSPRRRFPHATIEFHVLFHGQGEFGVRLTVLFDSPPPPVLLL